MKNTNNTFGKYKFEEWVPAQVREQIISFWGIFGRSHKDWLKNGTDNEREMCSHKPCAGFGNPPNGATVFYIIRDYKASNALGRDVFKKIKGKYIHAWNNIGRLVEDDGETHVVSSCDMWVRIYPAVCK